MTGIDASRYPPVIAELLQRLPLAPLGPGKPHRDMRDKLEEASSAFGPGSNRDMAAACCAGLWLAFDFLDESHAISQDLSTVEGSYWHALMHRREPDFGNSKYWFRRVGTHPVYASLGAAAAELAGESAQALFPGRQANWDPFAFVDLCQASYEEKTATRDLCRQVQRIEWELLFLYCCERALAPGAGESR